MFSFVWISSPGSRTSDVLQPVCVCVYIYVNSHPHKNKTHCQRMLPSEKLPAHSTPAQRPKPSMQETQEKNNNNNNNKKKTGLPDLVYIVVVPSLL